MRRILLFAMVLLFTSCGSDSRDISGAGATFPLPYYNTVFKNFGNESGINVSYGGIGSGGGISSLKDGVIDFAGSDSFLTDEEMKSMGEVIHIPTCLGAVVLAYNVEGNPNLNLTGELISEIYRGTITRWNDAKIVAINPGVTLPDKEINVVFRSDGSGTTYVFTDYLSKVSKAWSESIGYGKVVNFPVGIAAKGNTGVSGIIGNTPNSIGYISSEYAFAQRLKMASIASGDSIFIKPTVETITKSAQVEIPDDTRTMITNSTVEGAYPISCLTWILVFKEQNYDGRTLEKSQSLVQLLRYILSEDSQRQAELINYAPLPASLLQKAHKQIDKITYNGLKIQ